MSSNSKRELRAGKLQKRLGNIAYHKLFMLNLHAAIDNGFKLESIFQNFRLKCDGDYIFGKAFIVDTIIDIVETLDSMIFCLNSLSDGGDIDLFYRLDELRNYMNKCLDKCDAGNVSGTGGDKPPDRVITLTDLSREILDFSARISLAENKLFSFGTGDINTVHDLLIYCYNRIFELMADWFQSVASADTGITGRISPIIHIPISYLQQDGESVFDRNPAAGNNSGGLDANPGASRLCEGINEVLDSEFYEAFLEQSYRDINIQGLLSYSNETLALYHVSRRFNTIIAANICDAVGGNYINLLAGSASACEDSIMSHQLLGKLLDWLDFHSFSSYGFSMASIGNMNRNNMENHLNMLGKLLAFMASTAIPPLDEQSVQKNIEVFLENIV